MCGKPLDKAFRVRVCFKQQLVGNPRLGYLDSASPLRDNCQLSSYVVLFERVLAVFARDIVPLGTSTRLHDRSFTRENTRARSDNCVRGGGRSVVEHILGHVDAIRDGLLSGWIANVGEAGRAEEVHCEDTAGNRVVFHAWHAREDVRAQLGLDGRFGFVIPTSALRDLGPTVSIRSRLGSALGNGEAVAVPKASYGTGNSGPVRVVLHIPKTAGTSLRHSLTQGLSPAERLLLYNPPFGLTVPELARLPRAQKQAVSMVLGHAFFGVGAYLARPTQYLTILRQPLKRLRSHLAHHLAAGTTFFAEGRPVSLAEAFNQGHSPEFDNLMVRSIAGLSEDVAPLGTLDASAVDLALFNVQQHFAFVGFVETLAQDVQALSRLLGREIEHPGVENVRPPGDQARGGDRDIDWSRVSARNRFDQELYDLLLSERRETATADLR